MSTRIPHRQVRASQTDTTVRVYQAYAPAIAEPALAAQRFVAPFSFTRMTWIKPSFTWMMYRSGWGTKHGQERLLAIDIRRDGLDHALANAALASFEPEAHVTEAAWREQLRRFPARVQWDPERDLRLGELPHRALQLGLAGDLVERYVRDWIVRIEDVGERARSIHDAVRAGDLERAEALRPLETPYAVSAEVAARLGMDGALAVP